MRVDSDRKRMWRTRTASRAGLLALALALGSLVAAAAQAQGVRYDNMVLGPRGTPVAAAHIAVCTAAAARTATPCSPLAPIYSDQVLTQPAVNPFSADSLGNYGFWAQPGHYVVQIYGTGVTTRTMDIFLACDPTNCSMSTATFSSITAGTLDLTGGLTVKGRNVATQPVVDDAVQFVSPTGSDLNDGLSWGTAKQTIYAAWNALYAANGGSLSYHNGNGGTIYVAANTSCGGPVSGQGLWIMGPADPNWNGGNVPSGWVKAMPARVIGVGTNSFIPSAHRAGVQINCGSGASDNLPSLWLSGYSMPETFENLNLAGASGGAYQDVRMGIDSNGSRSSGLGGVASITFKNDDFPGTTNSAGGPAVDIGAATLEIYFYDDVFQGNNAAPGGTDQHQAMVINGGGTGSCQQPGLIYIRNSHLLNGSIKMYTSGCGNGGSLYVNGLITESQNDGKGAIWLTEDSSTGMYSIHNVTVADSNPVSPPVEVDSVGDPVNPDALVFSGTGYASVPGIYLGGDNSLYYSSGSQSSEPSKYGQTGFHYGKVWGQTDAGRRLFAFNGSRFANLANPDPSTWGSGNTTVTTMTGPDGSDYAGRVTAGTPIFDTTASQTLSVGDDILVGGWYRVEGTAGLGTAWPFSISILGCSAKVQQTSRLDSPSSLEAVEGEGMNGDGQWVWASGAFVVTAAATGCQIRFQSDVNVTSTGYIDYYAPVAYYIPASSGISDSEAADIANNMAPYPYGIDPPVVSTMPLHPIAFGGSGDAYLATLDHSRLTSNQTYTLPAAGGTVGVIVGQATVAGPTTAIAAGSCASTITTAMSGATTSMTVLATPNADPAAANYKSLTVFWFPTAGNVNLEVCNPSSASVTPGTLTFNVRAIE